MLTSYLSHALQVSNSPALNSSNLEKTCLLISTTWASSLLVDTYTSDDTNIALESLVAVSHEDLHEINGDLLNVLSMQLDTKRFEVVRDKMKYAPTTGAGARGLSYIGFDKKYEEVGSFIAGLSYDKVRSSTPNVSRRQFFNENHSTRGISVLAADSYGEIHKQHSKDLHLHDTMLYRYLYAVYPGISINPSRNRLAQLSKSDIQKVSTLIDVVVALKESNNKIAIQWSPSARAHFDEFMDLRWNESGHLEMRVESYTKMKKLAAVLAVIDNHYQPVVHKKHIVSALEYLDCEREFRTLCMYPPIPAFQVPKREVMDLDIMKSRQKDAILARFAADLGGQYRDIATHNSKKDLHALGMFPISHVALKCRDLKIFKYNHVHELSFTDMFMTALNELVAEGKLIYISGIHPLMHGRGKHRMDYIKQDVYYDPRFAQEHRELWENMKTRADIPPWLRNDNNR